MNIGKFRHLIDLQRPDLDHATTDDYGRQAVPWVPFATLYADVADVSGREFYEAAAHQLQNTVTFTVRWVSGVTADMRILWNGVAYTIDQINHLGYRRDFLRIKAHITESEGATHGQI